MNPKIRRRALTVASLVSVPVIWRVAWTQHDPARGLTLIALAVPMLWLIWALARASAHQHAAGFARDVEKIHAGRPRPMPHQEVSR